MTRLLILSIFLLSCCKHVERVPADLRIVVGQQGTFAGRSMGYTIEASGVVVRWEGKYPGEFREADGTIHPEVMRSLWRQAEEMGILEMAHQEMATVNNFVAVTADGESRSVTWVERDQKALQPVYEFFDACVEAAKTALGEGS